MKAYLTRRYSFPASHRLHCEGLTEAENQRVYGKCNNPYGHGHNYTLAVTVSGQVDANGMVCDLGTLDAFTRREVVEQFDHANLNTLPQFHAKVPTTENLCVHIYDMFRAKFSAARVEQVRLEETSKNFFEYAGGAELRH
jgi:6-pyruvoyltetrahydropterin/6-carboxytetrahydropterin synthase